jgi:hypothetical protein
LQVLFPNATRDLEPISYGEVLLSILLHASVYMFLHNLLNVLVQIENKMGLQKKNFIRHHYSHLEHFLITKTKLLQDNSARDLHCQLTNKQSLPQGAGEHKPGRILRYPD